METGRSSEKLIRFYQTTWRRISVSATFFIACSFGLKLLYVHVAMSMEKIFFAQKLINYEILTLIARYV